MKKYVACAAAAALVAAAFPSAAQEAIDRFDIARFQVEGNSLLEADYVERLLAPFAGRQRDFGSIQQAVEALEAAYQARGYNVVQVNLPEQELNQGVVLLQVVETRVGLVRVEGNRLFDEPNIRASLPGLQEGEAPNLARISASLKLANENPAKKTTLRLQSGAHRDEVDATLKVDEEDKVWRLGIGLDNSGHPVTGRTMLTTFFQHANLHGRDHVLSLQYTTTVEHPSQVNVFGAGYRIPLYRWGQSLDLFASHSKVDSATLLQANTTLAVNGRGTIFGARYNINRKREGDFESAWHLGLDHKAYASSAQISGLNVLASDVTVHPLSFGYSGNWSPTNRSMAFSASVVHNIPGGSKGRAADFAAARAGARAGYRAVRLNAAYATVISDDWQARLVLASQFSPDALIPGEQFGAGGQASVRGYAEREMLGDSGQSASAELYTPSLCALGGETALQCRLLAFADLGRVSRRNPQPGDPYVNATVAAVGAGLRLGVDKRWTMQLDIGRALRNGATTVKGDNRVHLKLTISY